MEQKLKSFKQFTDFLNKKKIIIPFVDESEQKEIEDELNSMSDDDKKMEFVGRFKKQKNGKYVKVR